MDLNTSNLIAAGIGNSVMGGQRSNSKNNKQLLNTSFDASKSANTINYVGSAYMSAVPSHHSNQAHPQISKVGLKHSSGNSRQPHNMHAGHQQNNYTDGTAMFLGHHSTAAAR